jgi:ABC-type sugar transport system permease subunit
MLLRRDQLVWIAFVVPALLLLFVFMAWPLVEGLRLSLYDWRGLTPPKWVGFKNFQSLIADRYFWRSLVNSLVFSLFSMIGTVGLGLLLAIAISRRVPGHRIYKFLFYMPMIIPVAVVAALWARLLEPNDGIVNEALHFIGLGFLANQWLADLNLALAAVIAVNIWGHTGFPMIVLLTAIEGISEELHEAFTLDGANAWQRIWYLILPLIKPVLISITVLQLILSLKVFDLVWIMTRGGPAGSTSILGTHLYDAAFEQQKFGSASAVAVVMFALIFTVTYLFYRYTKFGQEN